MKQIKSICAVLLMLCSCLACKKIELDHSKCPQNTRSEISKEEYIHFKENGYDTDLGQLGIKGFIKSATIKSYTSIEQFGVVKQGDFISCTKLKFNEDGKYTEIIKYNASGQLIETTTFTYNSLEESMQKELYNAQGLLMSKEIHKYNDNQILEVNYYSAKGELKSKKVYDYSNADFKPNFIHYDANGLVISKTVCTYLREKDMIEETQYDSKGLIIGKKVTEADWDNKLMEEYIYDTQGSLVSKSLYHYSPQRIDWINYDVLKSSETKFTTEFEYNNFGNWISKIDYQDTLVKTLTLREFKFYNLLNY